ncbi:MAG: helix-turn-helix domain-containing protein [Acidimicrobiia bacterium]
MTTTSIGELIRERRLALGFSLGQLATQLGETPAEVRRWERGEDVPGRIATTQLARVVDVDVEVLEAMRPEDVDQDPAADDPVADDAAVHPALDTPAASEPAPAIAGSFSDAAATASSTVIDGQGTGDESTEDRPPDAEPRDAVPTDTVPTGDETTDADAADPPPTRQPADAVPAQLRGHEEQREITAAPMITEAPTESIPAPVATIPRREEASLAAPEVPVKTRAPNPLELLFDPRRRWIYWIRYVLTVVALLVLFRVFVWAAGELWAALGELLDGFQSTEDADALVRSGLR